MAARAPRAWRPFRAARWVDTSRRRLALHEVVVRLLVEELRVVLRTTQLHDPPLPVWILVDVLRMVLELLIDVGHLTGHRAVEIGGSFDRLDHPEACANIEVLPDGGQFEVDDVAELRLRVLGDANGRRIAVRLDPLVALAESQGAHVCHDSSPSIISDEVAYRKVRARPPLARWRRGPQRPASCRAAQVPAARRPWRCCSPA